MRLSRNCIFPLPSTNLKEWIDYFSSVGMAGAEGDSAVKVVVEDQTERALHWLGRKRAGANGVASSWQPAKLHRKSSYLNSVYTDHQVSQLIPHGVTTWKIPEDPASRGPALQWKRASFSPDMDSSNVSMMNHWLYSLNIIATWFGTHGILCTTTSLTRSKRPGRINTSSWL